MPDLYSFARRWWALLFVVLTAGLAPPVSAAQDTIPVRRFTTHDGLPHESITALAQTTDGRLWVGTKTGLAIYDGRRFSPVPFPDSLRNTRVIDVQPLPDGIFHLHRSCRALSLIVTLHFRNGLHIAMSNLETLPFSDRLSRIGYLLKHTVTVVGRDADIITPWAWMVVYALVMVTAFFAGVIGAFVGAGLTSAVGFGLAVLMFLYKYFFYNYREMGQSWLVYETICGRDRSYADATQAAKKRKSGVRKLAGLDMLMAYLMSQRGSGEGGGWGQKLVNLFLSGLGEVWDLVNHYMLPAIAIDELTLTEGGKKMKELRNQVPETLVGVFGIDFIGRIVGQVTGILYVLLVLVSVGATYLGGEVLPEAFAFTIQENPIGSGPLVLNVLPILLGLYVAKAAGVIFERTVTSVKVVYFTVFYTQITHPDRIADDLQSQLVSYLRMEESSATPAAAPVSERAPSGS